ncbi:TPA: hypothetical protein ACW4J0_003849, partial [Salmonella enterica subsp. enterica serovar Infantis]
IVQIMKGKAGMVPGKAVRSAPVARTHLPAFCTVNDLFSADCYRNYYYLYAKLASGFEFYPSQ